MGTYEVIDHTADIGIAVHARVLPELFETAAEALFALIVDAGSVENRAWLARKIEADDLGGLLVAWLNDLLSVFSGEAFVPKVFVVDEVSESRLRATVHGEPVDPARHRFRRDVKAATYHRLEVSRDDTGWRATVIFDV
jgi:SHS2 domain-containing protein